MSNNIITFIDQIGRTIIGEQVESTPDGQKPEAGSFFVKNPAIIHVQPTQQGQLNVQTIPLYFRDFVSEKNKETGTFWKYHYSNVVVGVGVENDARLVEQYHRIFSAPAADQAQPPVGEGKTIKLFDD